MNILGVFAHYDDLELSSGGTFARFRDQGHITYAIITSSSEYTNYDGQIERTINQSIEEGKSALDYLGITHYNLKYTTKKVPFNSEMIEKIDKYISIINPDIIITHNIGENHQDHINTVKSVLAAGRRINTIWMSEPLYPSNLSEHGFIPHIYIDISPYINNKIKSIKLHKSQLKKYGNNWIKLVKSRAEVRGLEIKKSYAEAFQIIKMEYK